MIENGELLTLDFGATVNGYRSDMTRTVGFGRITGELRQIYETVRMAQQLGLDALAVGKPCGDVDRVARDYIDARYPGAFGHSLGHGVGLFIHEQPRLSMNSTDVLVARQRGDGGARRLHPRPGRLPDRGHGDHDRRRHHQHHRRPEGTDRAVTRANLQRLLFEEAHPHDQRKRFQKRRHL